MHIHLWIGLVKQMIDQIMYRQMLNGNKPLGEIRRNNASFVMNATFTNDPSYKKVRVLTRNGWQLYDAKYQYHLSQSISKDIVDWFLQFRPGVEFPIGTYVIIPADNDETTHTWEEEKKWFSVSNTDLHESLGDRTQLWMIVNRNANNQFVRYNVLQCNWNFQWIYNGKIQNCIGALRDAKSYTSGIWNSDYTVQEDNIISAIVPDIFIVYGKHYADLDLYDSRTIKQETRFMLTNNSYNPSVYMVSKVNNVTPIGLIQVTLKQTELDNQRDNIELRICNYYDDSRHVIVDVPKTELTTETFMLVGDSVDTLSKYDNTLSIPIGGSKYISVNQQVDYYCLDWKVVLHDESKDNVHPDEYYEKMIKIENIQVGAYLKVAKARSLIGKKFTISVSDINSTFYASLELEVTDYAT